MVYYSREDVKLLLRWSEFIGVNQIETISFGESEAATTSLATRELTAKLATVLVVS